MAEVTQLLAAAGFDAYTGDRCGESGLMAEDGHTKILALPERLARTMMLALADRVEGVTEPDREVDACIYEAVGALRLGPDALPHTWCAPIRADREIVYHGWSLVPAYTASYDAALTLVPRNFKLFMLGVEGGWNATLIQMPRRPGAVFSGSGPKIPPVTCAAALRARADLLEGEEG